MFALFIPSHLLGWAHRSAAFVTQKWSNMFHMVQTNNLQVFFSQWPYINYYYFVLTVHWAYITRTYFRAIYSVLLYVKKQVLDFWHFSSAQSGVKPVTCSDRMLRDAWTRLCLNPTPLCPRFPLTSAFLHSLCPVRSFSYFKTQNTRYLFRRVFSGLWWLQCVSPSPCCHRTFRTTEERIRRQ